MKLSFFCFCATAICAAGHVFAAGTVTYGTLLEESNGDASPRVLIGKSIVVEAVGFGELGFFTSRGKSLAFICKSGDKALIASKPKATTFSGTTVASKGWDGTTVWTLANCQVGAIPMIAVPAVGANAAVMKIKGDGNTVGSPSKPSLQLLQGLVFSDKDAGGWFFGLKIPGRKIVRLTYASDGSSKALLELEEGGNVVVARGYVGTYPDGSLAFDNARDVEITALPK